MGQEWCLIHHWRDRGGGGTRKIAFSQKSGFGRECAVGRMNSGFRRFCPNADKREKCN